MKALSVRSPWWWYILRGKDIENRDWWTAQRGRVLLHASKSWVRRDIAEDYAAAVKMGGPEIGREEWQRLRACSGCLVGAVEIVDCVRDSSSRWFQGKYGFVLRNPVTFAVPIPYRGALGFFDVPDVLVSQVRELGAA